MTNDKMTNEQNEEAKIEIVKLLFKSMIELKERDEDIKRKEIKE